MGMVRGMAWSGMDEHEFAWMIWDTPRRCFSLIPSILGLFNRQCYTRRNNSLSVRVCPRFSRHGQVWSGMDEHGTVWIRPQIIFPKFLQSLFDHKSMFSNLMLRAKFYRKGLSHRNKNHIETAPNDLPSSGYKGGVLCEHTRKDSVFKVCDFCV